MTSEQIETLRGALSVHAASYGWTAETSSTQIREDGNAETVANPIVRPTRYDIETAIRESDLDGPSAGEASARVDAFALGGEQALTQVRNAADAAALASIAADTKALAAAYAEWTKYPYDAPIAIGTASFVGFLDSQVAAGRFTAADKTAALSARPEGFKPLVSLWAALGIGGVRDRDINAARIGTALQQ